MDLTASNEQCKGIGLHRIVRGFSLYLKLAELLNFSYFGGWLSRILCFSNRRLANSIQSVRK